MSVNIPEAYANGTDDEQTFVANLALFFTGFFRHHIGLLEQGGPEAQQALLLGLEYLLAISYVDNLEVFKARQQAAFCSLCSYLCGPLCAAPRAARALCVHAGGGSGAAANRGGAQLFLSGV